MMTYGLDSDGKQQISEKSSRFSQGVYDKNIVAYLCILSFMGQPMGQPIPFFLVKAWRPYKEHHGMEEKHLHSSFSLVEYMKASGNPIYFRKYWRKLKTFRPWL